MNYLDSEFLAIAVLGLDEEIANDETIEEALFERFDVSFEQFHKIAEALMSFTLPARAAISGEIFQGFVKNGSFICKQPI